MAYEIRSVQPADEDQLLQLAKHLNTVNLPHDRRTIRELIERSSQSFAGLITDPWSREYVFVLVDLFDNRLVGTSMVVAQLGRREAPYIYFDVREEEKYSQTLDRHFQHTVLRIGYCYNGPTEIGGLVVHPDYRKRPDRLGHLISYVRFLFMASHRTLFRDEILAELLPPLETDGTSHLWEALGRHFTGMSYREADVLSKKNKEFIKSLFPDGDVYATLLPASAQAVIGKVGAQTASVETMLRRVGFRYAYRIDPFDGGPHFTASMDEIELIRRTKRTRLSEVLAAPHSRMGRALCAIDAPAPLHFRCAATCMAPRPDGNMAICADAATVLGIEPGDEIIVLPFD